MSKKRSFPAVLLLVIASGFLTACSSAQKASPMTRTPDFCNTQNGISIVKIPKKTPVHPAAGTPVGGDYNTKRK